MNTKLDNFVYLLDRYFNTYYEVKVKWGKKISREFFENEFDARERYDSLLLEMEEDKEGFDNVEVVLSEIIITREEDELESKTIYNDEV